MIDVGIIGLGLIGGSMGLALKKYVDDIKVWGYDLNENHQQFAETNGLIDNFLDKDSLNNLDILFLAVPVNTVIKVLHNIKSYLNYRQTIITDVGSTKAYLYETISQKFPEFKYIGGHPMAGKETGGPEGAEADLFRDKNYVLLKPQTEKLDDEFNYLKKIIMQLQSNIIALSPDVHDELVAFSSHLPQLLATCLMNEYIEVEKKSSYLRQLTGTGFKDMSRIAASEPAIWLDIFLTNKDNILKNIIGIEKQIDKFKIAITNEDKEAITKLMNSGRKKRLQLKEGE